MSSCSSCNSCSSSPPLNSVVESLKQENIKRLAQKQQEVAPQVVPPPRSINEAYQGQAVDLYA